MGTSRKRARGESDSKPDECSQGTEASLLLKDERTRWLVKSKSQMIEIVVGKDVLQVHRDVLVQKSKYFEARLNGIWKDSQGPFDFEHFDPTYLALYITKLYHASGMQTPSELDSADGIDYRKKLDCPYTLKELVEVYKIADYFVSEQTRAWCKGHIYAAMAHGHRTLLHKSQDEAVQRTMILSFADGYEAVDLDSQEQKQMGECMLEYVTEGMSYKAWQTISREMQGREIFIREVGCSFAAKLDDLLDKRRMKRRELDYTKYI